jgi:hypothetical protein
LEWDTKIFGLLLVYIFFVVFTKSLTC